MVPYLPTLRVDFLNRVMVGTGELINYLRSLSQSAKSKRISGKHTLILVSIGWK